MTNRKSKQNQPILASARSFYRIILLSSYFAAVAYRSGMKRLKEFYDKYKDYSLDVLMYGTFFLFLLILFVFFR